MRRAASSSKRERPRPALAKVCETFEQLICPLVPRASSQACLVKRFGEFVSSAHASFELLPLKDIDTDNHNATVSLVLNA